MGFKRIIVKPTTTTNKISNENYLYKDQKDIIIEMNEQNVINKKVLFKIILEKINYFFQVYIKIVFDCTNN